MAPSVSQHGDLELHRRIELRERGKSRKILNLNREARATEDAHLRRGERRETRGRSPGGGNDQRSSAEVRKQLVNYFGNPGTHKMLGILQNNRPSFVGRLLVNRIPKPSKNF